MDANRAFPANYGDFREYWPQSVRILTIFCLSNNFFILSYWKLRIITLTVQNGTHSQSNQIVLRPNRTDCWWQNALSTVPDTARFLPPPGQIPAERTAPASVQNSLRAVLISFLPSRRIHRHKGGDYSMRFEIFALWSGFRGIWQAAFPESAHTADRQPDAGQRKTEYLKFLKILKPSLEHIQQNLKIIMNLLFQLIIRHIIF